jgi:hypothetical protein
MVEDADERSELEARVYSRAGADEPRVERVDPVTGHLVHVTESEWRLLLSDRERALRAEERTDGGSDAPVRQGAERASDDTAASAPAHAASSRDRWRTVGALAAGLVAGAALVGTPIWVNGSLGRSPAVEIIITPTPDRRIAELAGLPAEPALDIFRDPEARDRALPAWLQGVFPRAHVAELVGPGEELPGAMVYAVVPQGSTACILVPLEPNGGVWNCTSMEHVVRRGLTMHAPLPANLGSDADRDGDGVTGDPSRSELLTVEWHADGTFLISRR